MAAKRPPEVPKAVWRELSPEERSMFIASPPATRIEMLREVA